MSEGNLKKGGSVSNEERRLRGKERDDTRKDCPRDRSGVRYEGDKNRGTGIGPEVADQALCPHGAVPRSQPLPAL